MGRPIEWRNETRRLRDLIPWEHNPREINKHEAERLGDSLAEFGQIQTIAIGPDNEIYDGHQRKVVWSLLPQFGPDHEVDVRMASRALTDKERQKLVVYLHRGTMGQWDWDELANTFEVDELLEWGFEEAELQLDWGKDASTDPGAQVDKAAELQEKWQVQRGQVWQVGRHRVMCGDSTCAEDVARLMGGERAALLVTSPPYAVGKDYETGSLDDWRDTVGGMLQAMAAVCPIAAINLGDLKCGPDHREVHTYGALVEMCAKVGWPLIGTRVWVKSPAWAQGPYWLSSYRGVDDFEFIGFFGVAEHKPRVSDDWRYRSTWDFPSVQRNDVHGAMFPVELPSRCIQLLTDAGDFAADAFAGTGTTLVACEQTGRIGYGMEIEPKYVAVTLERLAGMGLDAKIIEGVA